jgi:hypothetical protein
MDTINDNMNYADRMLRSIGSWAGTVANYWTKPPEKTTTPTIRSVPSQSTSTPTKPSPALSTATLKQTNASYNNFQPAPYNHEALTKHMTEEQKAVYQETESDLDEISNIMQDLKGTQSTYEV